MDRPEQDTSVAAVLLAGGASSRFDHELSKVYVPVAGRPLLTYSLSTLERSLVVDHIVLVVREDDRGAAVAAVETVAPSKLRAVVAGGATRHDSEAAGLAVVRDLRDVGWVMVHDAARPFVTLDLLDRLVVAGMSKGVGVVPGRPFDEAVVDVEGNVVDTSGLVMVQTPQLFPVHDALVAYASASTDGFHGVDTAETVAAYRDLTIEYVDGDERNLKLTTLEDLFTAQQWAEDWQDGRWATPEHSAD